MAKFKTASDILNSYDFLQAREKAQRYVKHEFQDYAIRLASDLGDLPHKAIYLRLAKTVNRSLLEQAAVFALGYFKELNKGKVFMWKLAQLRAETQQKKDSGNFDSEFVLKKMGKLYDELPREFFAKHEADFKKKKDLLPKIFGDQKQKIYFTGLNSGYEAFELMRNGSNVAGYDISRSFTDAAKKLTGSKKLVRKYDNAQLTKPESFDTIYSILWPLITLDAENKYIDTFAKALKPGGKLILEVLVGEENKQEWVKFTYKEKDYYKFEKKSDIPQLTSKLTSLGFDLKDILEVNKDKSLVVAIKTV